MAEDLRAVLVESDDQGYRCRLARIKTQNLETANKSEPSVLVKVAYSSLNYKDALAVTGKGQILKKYPLIPGIDASGIVTESEDQSIAIGSAVLVNGCGLGEIQNGGFAEYIRVPASWIVPLPAGLSLQESMILGTAGFTAALAVHRMLVNGQKTEMGPVVVTGATGGVGSVAIALLSQLGFEVWAVTGKSQSHSYLNDLGAAKTMSPSELELGQRPLEKAKFGGVIDNVGGEILSGLIRHVNLWGNVASIGLAQSNEFHGTVMPFILRGVSVLGISSANCAMPLRKELWQRLGEDWRLKRFQNIQFHEIALDEVVEASQKLIDRQIVGRTVIRLQD